MEGGQERRYYARPKVCQFCADRHMTIDYKQSDVLRRFVTEEARFALVARLAHAPDTNVN